MLETIKIDISTLTDPWWPDKTRRAVIKVCPSCDLLCKDGSIIPDRRFTRSAYDPYTFRNQHDCRSLREAIGVLKKYYVVIKQIGRDRSFVHFRVKRKK